MRKQLLQVIDTMRALLVKALSEQSVERRFYAMQLRSVRNKLTIERARSKEAYATVARVRSEIAELRIKHKHQTPDA